MNSSVDKFARPVIYIYSMHGFAIVISIPLHSVIFYCVLTKTPACAKDFTKLLMVHLVR